MDIILNNIGLAFFCLIVGYLFGSIPNGVWVGKIFFKDDVRNHGSHNSGGTNVSRVYGFKYGFLVYLFDFLKVAIPLWGMWAILTFVNIGEMPLIPNTARYLSGASSQFIVQWPVYWLVALGAVIGHCYPVLAQFKGGKAASVTFSTAIFGSWFAGIVSMLSFVITLKIKKYISLSSIVGSIMASVAAWLTCIPQIGVYLMYGSTLAPGYVFAIVMTLATIVLIIRHKENISRIAKGTESKITFLK